MSDGSATLQFIQNVDFKSICHLTIKFDPTSKELIEDHIAFRFRLAKAKMEIMHERLKEATGIIKSKNPSMLLHVQKSAIGSSVLQRISYQQSLSSRYR